MHDDKGVRLADREIWLDRSLDGTTGLRVGGLPGTFRFLAPSAFSRSNPLRWERFVGFQVSESKPGAPGAREAYTRCQEQTPIDSGLKETDTTVHQLRPVVLRAGL